MTFLSVFIGLWKSFTLQPPNQLVAESPIETLQQNEAINIDGFNEFYIKSMRDMAMCQIKGKCPVRLLIYECSDTKTMQCGGLGDRFRGLTALFYAAYSSKRLLLLNWTIPDEFGQLFHINEQLYGIKLDEGQTLLNVLLAKVSDRQIEAEHRHGLLRYVISDASIFISNQPVLRLLLVSFDVLHQIFTRPIFKTRNDEILRQLHINKISYDLAINVALKVLLKTPTELMTSELQKIRPGQFQGRCQVGTHLRAAPKTLSSRFSEWPRLSKQQIEQCFAQQIIQVARKSNCTLVYIASDSIEAKQWLQKKLEQEGIESYYAQSAVCLLMLLF